MKRNELPIVSPCGADWAGMKPQDIAKRFCAECNKHVHDLSRLTQGEARLLLSAPATEGLCVRYLYDERGEILFAAEATRIIPTSRLAQVKRLLTAAALAAAPLSVTACMGAAPRPTMGAIAPEAQAAPGSSVSAASMAPGSSASVAPPAVPVAAPR